MQNLKRRNIQNTCRKDPQITCEQIRLKAQKLNAYWCELFMRFLPVVNDEPSWRYSRHARADDAEQGWKLHISATILTAGEILERVAPFLISRNVQFKAPASLPLLLQLNTGVSHGYMQVGKFITVYPRSDDEAVWLASRLHKLTKGLPAPEVPFDIQYRPDSCVYYRYGAFRYREIEASDGRRIPAIRDCAGELVPDLREEAKPEWVNNPFQQCDKYKHSQQQENRETPLKSTYHIFRALKQRGKGGVYQAIDVGATPPRLCVVKEGRLHGEVNWDGCDGFQLVKYEAEILKALEAANIDVPHVYSTFELDRNYYLVTEFIEGNSLDELMKPRKRRFSIRQIFKYAGQIAELLAQIHAAGWVWRDCKPANLLVTKNGALRPLDFEGACPINHPSVFNWRTIEFSAPEDKGSHSNRATEAEDIYSLGSIFYYLLTGKIYQPGCPPIRNLRRNVPRAAQEIIEQLLVLPIQKKRPSAKSLARKFDGLLNLSR